MSRLQAWKRWVIKIGSSILLDDAMTRLRQDWLDALADEVAAARGQGCDILLVSSGAVALGRQRIGRAKNTILEEKQAAAAIGQVRLMAAFEAAFARHDIPVAQALLTFDDTETRRRWLNARATLETLREWGAIPIINENDTVATAELRYGDNDRLAARVAQMVGADLLILLSDVDGLYDSDPRSHPDARHIGEIRALTPDIFAMAGGAAQEGVGSGGMATKLEAAKIAWRAGCATVIVRGSFLRPITRLTEGALASWFLPPQTPIRARLQWLQGSLKPHGRVQIDEGAVAALARGASLLPAGIIAVEGRFERGDAVEILDRHNKRLGKGVSAYSAEQARALQGLRSDSFEQVLGFRGRPALIHRDDMVLDD